jgi:hypothetical protein
MRIIGGNVKKTQKCLQLDKNKGRKIMDVNKIYIHF